MSERNNPSPDRKKRPRSPEAEAARQHAVELMDTGMPPQMAHAVAHGRLTLRDALERMARRDQVEKLMEQHDLSRALATQIALGQVELDGVLARRRLDEHREANRDRSVLIEHAASGAPVVLFLHGDRKVTGRIVEVLRYDVVVQPLDRDGKEDGDPETVHKLQIKLAHPADDYKAVRKALKRNKQLQRAPLEPIPRPQDRYGCSDKRLFRYLDGGAQVQATLLEGEVVRGAVAWFSRFEIGMELRGGTAVVFRHALQDLREV